MRRRWQPKKWPSLRHPDRGTDEEFFIPVTELVRDLWPNVGGWRRPWWARLAYQRRWMTAEAYYAEPASEKCADPLRWLYEESPLLSLIRKDTNFGEGVEVPR